MNTARPRRGRAQSKADAPGRKKPPAAGLRRSSGAEGAPRPAELARAVARRLAAEADPAGAKQFLSYFKPHEHVRVFGVKTARVREVAAEAYQQVRGGWVLRDAVTFAELCVKRREMETRGIGTEILGKFAAVYEPCLLHRVQRWLAAGCLDNWASVDSMAGHVVAPLLERFPQLVPELTGWHTSANLWLRRMSIVPLVPFARHGRLLDESYGTVEALLGDREDLMHKAMGWLLREAGKTDAPRLERFLREHGPAVPRTTLRYAIERFPAPRRKALLESTREGAA